MGIRLLTKPLVVNDLTPRIVQAGDGRAPHCERRLLGAAADVRRSEEIRQRKQPTIGGRLDRVDIERSSCQALLEQCHHERLLVDNSATRGVDEKRSWLHERELR